MPKYRKKPVVIEAVQWTGDNLKELIELESDSKREIFFSTDGSKKVIISTLEGDMTADVGDYIIKGVHGELYPCKPDVFDKTYEKVD